MSQTKTNPKITSLYSKHIDLSAKIVEFAGYKMPIQYKSITSEHLAVRNQVGIFDVSHMGQVLITGANSYDFIQELIPSNLAKLKDINTGLYTQLLNDKAGIIDDLIIYRLESGYLLIVNASNTDKVLSWFEAKNKNKVSINYLNGEKSLIAVQGPSAIETLTKIAQNDHLKTVKSFSINEIDIENHKCLVARSGYTGEDGFEISVDNDFAPRLWDLLIEKGQEFSLTPCGLGARDTLRIEAALPLYGHELDDETTPIEANLSWCVKLDKPYFIGKDILEKQMSAGTRKKLVCLKTNGKLIPRQGYPVLNRDNKQIGSITSGTLAISLGYPIAMAYLDTDSAILDSEVNIAIREHLEKATIVKRPFYKRST